MKMNQTRWVGLAALIALIAWLVLRKKGPKFQVGQRVALIASPANRGTVTSISFGVGGIQAFSYLIEWDSGASPSLIEERFLMAI